MKEITTFTCLTLLWSWGLWAITVPYLREHGFDDATPSILALHLLGSYGPTIVALLLTGISAGKTEVRALLGQLFAWRGRTGKLLLALFLPTLLSLAALAIYAVTTTAVELDFSRSLLFPIALLAALPFGPLAEEIGWRGYAQPRLLGHISPLLTGLLLGTLWFVWHIPLFFAPAGTSVSGSPITPTGLLLYLGSLSGMSILIVWFSQWTAAGLLSGLLMHLGMNAEIYRLFFDLESEQLTRIEHWSVLPVWLLVLGLLASGWGRRTKGVEQR